MDKAGRTWNGAGSMMGSRALPENSAGSAPEVCNGIRGKAPDVHRARHGHWYTQAEWIALKARNTEQKPAAPAAEQRADTLPELRGAQANASGIAAKHAKS